MPNAFASLMLVIWPLVAWRLFLALPPGRALIWSLLGAYLLLPPPPAEFDFPLMPPLDKSSLPNLAMLVIVVVVLRLKPQLLPETRVARVLVAVFVLSPVATVFTNSEPLVFTESFIRGLHLQDAIAQPINQMITLLGFLLARNYLTTREDQRDLLIALCVAGLAYSLPILLEVRLSPQLNNWIYGYYQHLFSQTIRGGGYRPMVFLYHGIWLAFFVLTCLLATLALWRGTPDKGRAKYLIMAGYLLVVLVLCKTLATLIYAALFGSIILFAGTATQTRIALVLAVLACLYPALKVAGLVPANAILAQAETVSAERAQSLAFRIQNEDVLLERANQKPLFGWGIWGRNHLRDPDTGHITSVTDGNWIIVLGVWGWVGYGAHFGLLTLPIFMLWRMQRRAREQEITRFRRALSWGLHGGIGGHADPMRNRLSPFVGPLTLMLGVNLIDLLPNATTTPMTWIIAGMLLGHAERLAHRLEAPAGAEGAEARKEAAGKTPQRMVL